MRTALALLLSAAAWPVAANAQAPTRADWSLTRDAQGCTIARAPKPRDDTHLILSQPLNQPYRLIVDGPGFKDRISDIAVEVLSDWERKPVLLPARASRNEAGTQITLRADNAGRLPGARALRFHDIAGRKVIGHVEAPGLEAALVRVRRCTTESAQVDRGSGESPVASPTGGLTSIERADYPAGALRAGAQGRAVVQVTVSAQGRASGCTVTRTSGSELLDETTCLLFARRARFAPARDAQGRPTQAPVEKAINWSLP